jgi:uncharacterized protein YhjY with autotransporter beta-barrel domain
MRRVFHSSLRATLACCVLLGPGLAFGQGAPVTGSLVTLANAPGSGFNRLERLAAIANQATYNQLTQGSGGSNPPCIEDQQAPSGACTAELFRVLENVRELVHTANELLGGGSGRPTQFSLGLDEEGLGFALRWTAAEELSTLSSASSEFANTQIASLMSRITALRFGASGFSVAGVPMAMGKDGLVARAGQVRGGGASADDADGLVSKWGGFLNGSFGWGDRKPTELEDAFAFDGKDITLGVDYRFSQQLVLGGMVGYSKQRIEFDSRQSVVDGGIDLDGYSLSVYALQEWQGPYLSASLSWQSLSIDSTRVINYPSFNINAESVYATAYGSTDSTRLSASVNFGWPLNHAAFGFEPYVRGEYARSAIDAFRERSVDNLGGGGPAGFDFAFGKQTIKSMDTAAGFRAQYAFTPSFGVLVPYLVAELHHDFDDNATLTRAVYNEAAAQSGQFELPEDKPDVDYFTVTAGASMVLPRGFQGFVQLRSVEGLRNVTNRSITLGIRAEF